MQTIFFDIETGSLPELELMMPPFDKAKVKTGNMKDPQKIADKVEKAEEEHKREFTDKAALDARTGRVLAIGLMYADTREFRLIPHDDESTTLREFWDACRCPIESINQMIGFNVRHFDLPFLIRRSWKHRVPVPLGVRHGRYWSEQIVDLREVWQLGDRDAKGSLDTIAKHLGVGAKNGEGSEFANLWESDREQAVEYLQNDLNLTARVADAFMPWVNCREEPATKNYKLSA